MTACVRTKGHYKFNNYHLDLYMYMTAGHLRLQTNHK